MGSYIHYKHFGEEKVLANIGTWALNNILTGCSGRFGIGEGWGAWYILKRKIAVRLKKSNVGLGELYYIKSNSVQAVI